MSAIIAFLALIAELIFGYSQLLVKTIGHPVIWIGNLIDVLDHKLNRTDKSAAERRRAGIIALLVIIFAAAGSGLLAQWLSGLFAFGWLIVALLAASLIAQRSLANHVAAVIERLQRDGLDGGRVAVSQIVGRDTEALDESGISRAAIESLAENFSDGVVAPVFWLVLGGLPGIAAYKAINTADSMIGHKSERHVDFGRAAARLDDLVNLPASRLTAGLVVVAALLAPGLSARSALRAIRNDARSHRSPNAGWPEAAFAGALGLELAGPRSYGGQIIEDAVMGKGGRPRANCADIRRAITLYWITGFLLIAIVGLLAILSFVHF